MTKPGELPSIVARSVSQMDAWLDTMRAPEGYSGPVAHWWQQCLLYTGAGLDWRYEGIIAGYLILWDRTGERCWLEKARRAADDMVGRQLENGHFPASAFEANPATAGTPHEAACDAGLLNLAQVLKDIGDSGWESYSASAELNLCNFYLDQLWDPHAGVFHDDPVGATFVPNKAATACEAFFRLAELKQDASWVDCCILSNLDAILRYQVTENGPLHGAIAQNSIASRRIEKYFPIYVARCIPALLRGYDWSRMDRYLVGAVNAIKFLQRWMNVDGSFPAVIYQNLKINRFPCWIAPLGDVLRAEQEIRPYGISVEFLGVQERLLSYQDASGGIQTGRGFAAVTGGELDQLPEFRDLLHITGWVDKAFRALAAQVPKNQPLPRAECGDFISDCVFRGRIMQFGETSDELSVSNDGEVVYRWNKGQPRPEIAIEDFWLR